MAKGLSRTTIVAAALELLDQRGIDRLTVRALAERLGVRAPALYWHVRDKQALLDEMGTEVQRRVVAAVAAAPAEPDWVVALGGYARIVRREYLAHRDGARTFAGTRLTDPELLRAQEPWLAGLAAAGVDVEQAVLATQTVTAFVVGFVIEEQERRQSDADRYDLTARDTAVGEGYPLVRAAGRVLAADPDARFEAALAIVLRGVRAATAQDTADPPENPAAAPTPPFPAPIGLPPGRSCECCNRWGAGGAY